MFGAGCLVFGRPPQRTMEQMGQMDVLLMRGDEWGKPPREVQDLRMRLDTTEVPDRQDSSSLLQFRICLP